MRPGTGPKRDVIPSLLSARMKGRLNEKKFIIFLN